MIRRLGHIVISTQGEILTQLKVLSCVEMTKRFIHLILISIELFIIAYFDLKDTLLFNIKTCQYIRHFYRFTRFQRFIHRLK